MTITKVVAKPQITPVRVPGMQYELAWGVWGLWGLSVLTP